MHRPLQVVELNRKRKKIEGSETESGYRQIGIRTVQDQRRPRRQAKPKSLRCIADGFRNPEHGIGLSLLVIVGDLRQILRNFHNFHPFQFEQRTGK